MMSVKKSKEKAAKPTKAKVLTNDSTAVENGAPAKPASKKPSDTFPIVGIGASAGGLAAFEAFFSAMSEIADPGMAFVLVQHLAPDRKSMLTEIIQRCTQLPVFEVEDGVIVQPNCIYIIPPNRDLAFVKGSLQLLEPSAPRGHRFPIDFFFQSMAQALQERAIGIILSGTGSDGTEGVRVIKEAGGMIMAQKPGSSEYDGMPRSVIATGLVDYELPPAEMPGKLMAYVSQTPAKQLHSASLPTQDAEGTLKKVFSLLRNHSGHDFSQYKSSSVGRRIERRMAVHQIESIEGYVQYMQQTPEEVEALFRDLLIGVTHFFRDPEAFKALEEKGISKLLAKQPAEIPIRVWVPSCSTGEEVYSIAILLREQMEAQNKKFPIQIFATDIDNQAIAKARAGIYPSSISADISPERLSRFFTAEADDNRYRIQKIIRDMVVFSVQNVIKDPPFSKMDLISCRNLMIYMDGDLQKKLIPLFHYALNPKGILFLGTSETVGKFQGLFSTLDSKSKVFERKDTAPGVRQTGLAHILPTQNVKEKVRPHTPEKKAGPDILSLKELTEQELLKNFTTVAVLVNTQGDILYLHGKSGMYLEPAPGEVKTMNILSMARQGLKRELQAALRSAIDEKKIIKSQGVQVKTNGHFTAVDLTVRPVKKGITSKQESNLFLVILEDASKYHPAISLPSDLPVSNGSDPNPLINALQQELRVKEEYLLSTNEAIETSNEELKSSNEEMQSLNEELQSTNEELETSKEELQSINEELTTVNSELQTKVTELSRTNNDMNNLMAGTGIATIFVDHELRILRFTPTATRITNLILSDVGRPVGHIASNLVGYNNLAADVKAVLDTLTPREREVKAVDGQWYTLRIQPYRTLDNVIEGAVISFVDITEIVNIRDSLEKVNAMLRLAVVVKDSNDAITVQDLDGRIMAWNPGAVRMYGWSETEALEMNVQARIPENKRAAEINALHQLALSRILKPYKTQRLAKDGSVLEVVLTATGLINDDGNMYAIATTERTNV